MKQLFLILLLAAALPATAQDILTIQFESEPGVRLSAILDSITTSFGDRADLNGDGKTDLTLLRLDEQDNPVEIFTLDAVGPDVLWSIDYADVADALGTSPFRFVGFFSFSAEGPRHAIFRGRGVLGIIAILIGKRSAPPLVLPAGRVALLDLTGDGTTEVILQNPESGTVQVYGDATGTATEDAIAAALRPLLESYPNPFRAQATIAYDLPEGGPVTLEVYDLLGRRVRTLVEAVQPPGRHAVSWDGRDAAGASVAAGVYLYRLRLGEATASQQIIRLR